MCQQKKSEGVSLQSEMACLDSLLMKNPAQRGFQEGTRILHHVWWQHRMSHFFSNRSVIELEKLICEKRTLIYSVYFI